MTANPGAQTMLDLAERYQMFGQNSYRPEVFGVDDKASGPMLTQAECFQIATAIRAASAPVQMEQLVKTSDGFVVKTNKDGRIIEIISGPAAPVQGAGEPVAWLIERPEDDNMPVRWWNPADGWMRDANKAIHFVRQTDAECYLSTMRFGQHLKVTEHKFVVHPSSDRPASEPSPAATTGDIQPGSRPPASAAMGLSAGDGRPASAPDLYAYIPDIVKNAMLTMWNYICDDSKHHPLDIEHGRSKLLTFEPKHWAQFTGEMVQRNIRDLFGPHPASAQEGVREALQAWERQKSSPGLDATISWADALGFEIVLIKKGRDA